MLPGWYLKIAVRGVKIQFSKENQSQNITQVTSLVSTFEKNI